MLVVMVGGAPGVGKTTAARRLLAGAAGGRRLVQWVDVDALWLHQPWRVEERTIRMVESNLRAVAHHAAEAEVDVLVITWVFQTGRMHRIVRELLPDSATSVSVQLRAAPDTWRRRFVSDPERPAIDDFYRDRYASAQAVEADHRVDTDGLTPAEVAGRIAAAVGLAGG